MKNVIFTYFWIFNLLNIILNKQKYNIVVVTYRNKNQTIRDEYSLYDFETQYLKPKQKQLRQRLGALIFKLNKEKAKLDRLNDNTYMPAIVFGGKSLCRQAATDKNKKKLRYGK